MKKIVVVILIFLNFLFFLFPKQAFAQKEFIANREIHKRKLVDESIVLHTESERFGMKLEDTPTVKSGSFITNVVANYDVHDSGITTVSYNITLTNNSSDLYVSSYSLNLTGTKVQNPRATQSGKILNLQSEESHDQVKLKVSFDDAVVGKGNARHFSINFDDSSLATKTGEVWEVSIPKLSDPNAFDSFTVKLSVPSSFGSLAYISPDADRTEGNISRGVYVFEKETISKAGVTAAFGQFQVFEFDLTYHLENPLNKIALAEIAIPPDTAYQKVNYTLLDPFPETVTIDEDGNWIAIYKLKPRQRVDIKAKGAVQIFAGARYESTLSNESRSQNLSESLVWQARDPLIKEIVKRLNTPQDIYNFVVNTLKYDYERVKPNVVRMGARSALQNPKNAICMEFTDLFITLARAKGIPAREINGFAYTENPELQPLSLVADVLHAWPEYWDETKKVWVPVDPTWGNTTGGIDYFSKLDLRHFTFIVHGKNPIKPYPPGSYKLGANPQKDVFVNFGKLPEKRIGSPEIKARLTDTIFLFSTKLTSTIRNPGPTSIEDKDIEIFFDDEKVLSQMIPLLPPFSITTIEKKIPFSLLGSKTPNKVTIEFDGQRVTLPTQKPTVIILSLGLILMAIFLSILYIFLRTKRKDNGKIKQKFKEFAKRLFNKKGVN